MTNQKQLYERLWAAAEQLRAGGALKLNAIAEPILGLIFLKFADVKFRQAEKEILAERGKASGRQAPITPDNYKQHGVPYIPETARYAYLMKIPESENIGRAINDAMKTIEEENRELAGILPQDYTKLSSKPADNNRYLLTLLRNFNQISDDIDGDAFGGIYEYFLGKFARSEGANGGEFFTPQSIVKLLVEVIEPYHGKIFDPACGSGGMFVQSANFVALHQKNNKQSIMEVIKIYGQEKTEDTVKIAKMNLAIHGLSGIIENDNSFYEDPHKSIGQFDYVLANPPFNVKGRDINGQMVIDPARLQADRRYNYGLPLTGQGEISNANYLWMQMIASALSSKGRAGFVMANSSSDAGHKEKEIRAKMTDAGFVDVIISVGPKMFMNAPLSCTLWFFDKGKIGTDRQKKILFINAQDIFLKIDAAHHEWTDEHLQEISGIVRRYRGEEGAGEYKDIKGRCKVATLDEIKANDYSLNPGRYVEIVEKEMDDADFEARMKELMGKFTTLTKDAHELENKIQTDWKKIL